MFKEKFSKLIDVKSIVTISILAVFCYLNVAGKEVSDGFNNIFTVIIAFYFGTQSAKGNQSVTSTITNEVLTNESEVIVNGD